MKPAKKSQTIEDFLDKISLDAFGKVRSEEIKRGDCVCCGEMVTEDDFNDELSKKEYTISGLCQSCQDSVFNDLGEYDD